MWQFVCSREQKGTKNLRRNFFCSFLGLLSFCSSFFFSSQTQVCFCVVVKNTRIRRREKAFCGRALTVVLLRLRVKGVEGRSTLRLTMIITTRNVIWAVRRLWFQRIILWVSFRYEYEEERGFFVLYLSQARLSCSRALCARERDLGSLSLSLLMERDDADDDYTT